MTSGTCKSRSKLVPIIDSSDSDMEPSYSEVINGRNESSTHTGMVSSSSSGRSRMSETRKQSGSRRKRRRISSDSSDKENSNTIYSTPTRRLRKRRADSNEKVKRNLMLEKIKEKRFKSVRKRLDVSKDLSESDVHVQVKTPVPAHDQYGSSSDDFESPPNGEEDDDDLVGFIVSESSREADVQGGVTFIKNGDFVASRQLNKFNIHELYCMEDDQLTRFQPLKSKIKFIATDEHVQITDHNLDEYIGPILVQHCEPYEDSAIVKTEQELKVVCNALLSTESGGKLLKVAKTSTSTSSSVGSYQKLPLEEAHARCVQMVFSSLVDHDFLRSLEEQEDLYFVQAKKDVEFACSSKTGLVLSNVWDPKFKDMLKNCPILTDTELPFSYDAICQACKRNRHITRSFEFYEKENDEMACKEFRIGCFCADKAIVYHRLCHYITVELKESCREKLEEDMAEGNDRSSGVVDIVNRLCVENDSWQNELFSEFKKLLSQADKWALDGKEHRRMMSSVTSYYK